MPPVPSCLLSEPDCRSVVRYLLDLPWVKPYKAEVLSVDASATKGADALIVNGKINVKASRELSDFKLKFEGEQQKTAHAGHIENRNEFRLPDCFAIKWLFYEVFPDHRRISLGTSVYCILKAAKAL
jgi:hypothetical protein